jgi:hypothetical protein
MGLYRGFGASLATYVPSSALWWVCCTPAPCARPISPCAPAARRARGLKPCSACSSARCQTGRACGPPPCPAAFRWHTLERQVRCKDLAPPPRPPLSILQVGRLRHLPEADMGAAAWHNRGGRPGRRQRRRQQHSAAARGRPGAGARRPPAPPHHCPGGGGADGVVRARGLHQRRHHKPLGRGQDAAAGGRGCREGGRGRAPCPPGCRRGTPRPPPPPLQAPGPSRRRADRRSGPVQVKAQVPGQASPTFAGVARELLAAEGWRGLWRGAPPKRSPVLAPLSSRGRPS